jgi:hypothetical protein
MERDFIEKFTAWSSRQVSKETKGKGQETKEKEIALG